MAGAKICFDLEVKWNKDFRYLLRDYQTAWRVIASLDEVMITGATAYFIESKTWRSFPIGGIQILCKLIADAEKVVTFNGKLWDLPVLGRLAKTTKLQNRLKALCAADAGTRHDDMCQIANVLRCREGSGRHELALLNFGQARIDQWSVDREEYKFGLNRDGWAREDAWQACKAWEDASTTHALWRRWRGHKLKI
jgi:hypothetical protein